jgi:opacity protein-like surface antigen
MKLKFAFVALGALVAASVPAAADGIKDRGVPAPIPVPAPVPIREGFSYYLRADLGYAWAADNASFSENGSVFGAGGAPFVGAAPFAFGQAPQFGALTTETHDLFIGTIGFGAYFAPRLRGDFTLDFRGKQGFDANTSYAYASTPGGIPSGNIINGVVRETFRTTATVAMVNGYFDILPRGAFSPYVGAGIGFAYYDIDRGRYNREVEVTAGGIPTATAPQTFNATSKDTTWGLAAALMAGVSFSFDHRWAIDVGYRAQYLDEASVDLTTAGGTLSKATFGDHWEHQARIGIRWNIW